MFYPEFLEILQMDVTKEEEVKEAADKVRKKYEHIRKKRQQCLCYG